MRIFRYPKRIRPKTKIGKLYRKWQKDQLFDRKIGLEQVPFSRYRDWHNGYN